MFVFILFAGRRLDASVKCVARGEPAAQFCRWLRAREPYQLAAFSEHLETPLASDGRCCDFGLIGVLLSCITCRRTFDVVYSLTARGRQSRDSVTVVCVRKRNLLCRFAISNHGFAGTLVPWP